MSLDQNFFARSTLTVAEELLGKHLVVRKGSGLLSGMITEVEAYDGPDDKACHAHRGLTQRNAPMFGPAGHWYVYLVYGMYWMLNIVTREEGYPSAVLIRGACKWDGPGKLTSEMGINKRFNAKKADHGTGLWIEDRGIEIPFSKIKRTPRIGIDYAGAWAKKPYRFVLIDN